MGLVTRAGLQPVGLRLNSGTKLKKLQAPPKGQEQDTVNHSGNLSCAGIDTNPQGSSPLAAYEDAIGISPLVFVLPLQTAYRRPTISFKPKILPGAMHATEQAGSRFNLPGAPEGGQHRCILSHEIQDEALNIHTLWMKGENEWRSTSF